jgi:signal transduction histidine kinase
MSQINQVFMNILINAGQAITENGTIRIATGVEGEEVWIDISDNGSGIPADIIGRIFDPFFTTKQVGIGTGLGLSLSYSIIEKHGGRIEVDCLPGDGARFRVWLPVRSAVNTRS